MLVKTIFIGLLKVFEKTVDVKSAHIYNNDFGTIEFTDVEGKKYTVSIRCEDGNV